MSRSSMQLPSPFLPSLESKSMQLPAHQKMSAMSTPLQVLKDCGSHTHKNQDLRYFQKQQAAADHLKKICKRNLYLKLCLKCWTNGFLSTQLVLWEILPFIQGYKVYKKKVTKHLFPHVSLFLHRKQFFQIVAKQLPTSRITDAANTSGRESTVSCY